jgi:hypothetical protein
VLRHAHAPHDHRGLRLADHPSEPEHLVARRTGLAFELVPGQPAEFVHQVGESGTVLLDETPVDPIVLDHEFQRPGEEGDVSTHVHKEEPIRDLSSEDRALDVRRDPVLVHPRLAVVVDDGDLGALFLRVVEVLHRHRLVVGDVRTDEHDQIASDPVRVGTRRRRHSQRLLQPERARRMTDPCRVVDRVGSHRPHALLNGVVVLVGHASAGEIEGEPIVHARSDTARNEIERLGPIDPPEARFTPPPDHRVRQAAEVAELGTRHGPQVVDVAEKRVVQRRHRVQP